MDIDQVLKAWHHRYGFLDQTELFTLSIVSPLVGAFLDYLVVLLADALSFVLISGQLLPNIFGNPRYLNSMGRLQIARRVEGGRLDSIWTSTASGCASRDILILLCSFACLLLIIALALAEAVQLTEKHLLEG